MRIRECLGQERPFWTAGTLLLGAIAIAKGIHAPQPWALAQAQLDYSQGFVKRGLPGAMYTALGVHHYGALSGIFFLELVVCLAVLAWYTARSGLARRFGSPIVYALFAGSYVVTYLTHLVGYYDLLSLTLLVLLLLVDGVTARFIASLIVIPVALLIHENFLLLFLPALLFRFLLDTALSETATDRRRVGVFGALLAVASVAVTLVIASKPSLTHMQMEQLVAEAQARSDYPLQLSVFAVLARPFGENLAMMREALHTSWWWNGQALSVFNLLPFAAFAVWLSVRLLRRSGLLSNRWVAIGFWIALIAPLSMHLLGWDAFRWNALVACNAYLLLLTLSTRLPFQRLELSSAEKNLMVLVIAVQMATGYGMFNETQINPYPFYPVLVHHNPQQ